MYFLAMFNNSVVKPFIIADNNALFHLGRGILSYLCPLAGGFLSEGDFVRFPTTLSVSVFCKRFLVYYL